MWPSLRGSCLIHIYFYRKLTFEILLSWPAYSGVLLIEETTMAGFPVYLHIIWKYQPMYSPQTNNKVKLPKWLYWKVMLLFKIRCPKIWKKNIIKDQSYLILIFLFSPCITKHISICNKNNLEKFTGNSFKELLNLVM